MIINEEKALERLYSPDNLINIRKMTGGNKIGSRDIDPLTQTLAVETGLLTTQREAAEAFGMSQQNVSYLTHHGKQVDRTSIKTNLETAHSVALDVMLESLDLLKPKLSSVKKATDLSKIAADMGRAIEKITPKNENVANVKVVVFRPNSKDESDYEEITVTA